MGMWVRTLASRADWAPTAAGIVIGVGVVGFLLYLHFSRRGRLRPARVPWPQPLLPAAIPRASTEAEAEGIGIE
jgi:hypothetical protein